MLKKILWCFVGCFVLWGAGLFWFTGQIPRAQATLPEADAIVVFTGGKGRLEYSLRLLTEGKGERLFISGVGNIRNFEELLRRFPEPLQDNVHALPENAITLGRQAENTIGNAMETANWAKAKNVRSLLLVTSNYHMPRALLEMGEVMPQVALIPASVIDPVGYNRLFFSEYHKFLAAKFRHWLLLVIR